MAICPVCGSQMSPVEEFCSVECEVNYHVGHKAEVYLDTTEADEFFVWPDKKLTIAERMAGAWDCQCPEEDLCAVPTERNEWPSTYPGGMLRHLSWG